MKVISSNELLSFLEDANIEFYLSGKIAEFYTIASIFETINKGLYYFVGDKFPRGISNSLILVSRDNHVQIGSNVAIYLSHDPKLVYYKFLSNKFQSISNGEISPHSIIDPNAKIGENVQIDPFSVIGNVRIGDNCIIRSHNYLHDNVVLGENVIIEQNCTIGATGVAWMWNQDESCKVVQPQLGGVEIGNNSFLGSNTIVVRGSLSEKTKIGTNTLIAPGCRFGHGSVIGNFVHIANSVVTGGNASMGDYTFLGSAAVLMPKVRIHDYTIVGAGAVVVKNTTKVGLTLVGVPAKERTTASTPSGMPKPKTIISL